MESLERIETHNLDSTEYSIVLRNILHKNNYDITKLHRHNYFEIMFFQCGGGENLIDFNKYDVKSNSCYLIYPGQTHLFKKLPGAYGKLIQFKESAINSPQLLRLLQIRAWSGEGAVLFEEDDELMKRMMSLFSVLSLYTDSSKASTKEIKQYLLHALLQDLCSINQENQVSASKDSDFFLFQKLIDEHFKREQQVGFYIDKLSIGEKKLAALTKKHLGLSPLQVIHSRLLLEARRLLSFQGKSNKEISYELGFINPASFSTFVKKKTGLTATEVRSQLTGIKN